MNKYNFVPPGHECIEHWIAVSTYKENYSNEKLQWIKKYIRGRWTTKFGAIGMEFQDDAMMFTLRWLE